MIRISSKIFTTILFLSLATCRFHQNPNTEIESQAPHNSHTTGSTGESSTSNSDTVDSPSSVVPLICSDLLETDPELLEPCHTAGWLAGGVIHSQADLEQFRGQECIADGIILGEINEPIDLSPLADIKVICGALSLQFFDGGAEIRNLSALKNLRIVGGYITLHGFNTKNLEAFESLEATSVLHINYIQSLHSLASLSALRRANEIQISQCPQLTSLQGLGQIEDLQKLELFGLSELMSLEGLGSLRRVQRLQIDGCPLLNSLDGLSKLQSIDDLQLSNITSLSSLEGLSSLTNLSSLLIHHAPEFVSFDALDPLANSLQSLRLNALPKLLSLEPLRASSMMSSLSLVDTPQIESLNPMVTVERVERLTLASTQPSAVTFDLQGLKNLRRVDKALVIHGINNWETLVGLEELVHAEELSIISLASLNDLSALNKLRVVEYLRMGDLPKLEYAKAQSLASALSASLNSKIVGCQDQTPLPIPDCPWFEDGDCDENWSIRDIGELNVCIDDGADCGPVQE